MQVPLVKTSHHTSDQLATNMQIAVLGCQLAYLEFFSRLSCTSGSAIHSSEQKAVLLFSVKHSLPAFVSYQCLIAVQIGRVGTDLVFFYSTTSRHGHAKEHRTGVDSLHSWHLSYYSCSFFFFIMSNRVCTAIAKGTEVANILFIGDHKVPLCFISWCSLLPTFLSLCTSGCVQFFFSPLLS